MCFCDLDSPVYHRSVVAVPAPIIVPAYRRPLFSRPLFAPVHHYHRPAWSASRHFSHRPHSGLTVARAPIHNSGVRPSQVPFHGRVVVGRR